METLIPIINKLQDVFQKTGCETSERGNGNGIDLPQIVVVGSQSCGKSSVLESLVKKPFLPRGMEIVTRCPLILQMEHLDCVGKYGVNAEEYCILSHEPEKVYINFDEVSDAIQKRTDCLAGSEKGISNTEIIVKVFSPNVLSLTVVDLPGIMKVAVEGQPEDIAVQTKNLILHYINKSNVIILAVSQANVDIANSESLKLAKKVDPNGDRTVAVITKLDLMDRGTDATKLLDHKVIQVKLGIIGVINRSQYDINQGKTIEKSLEDEEDFIKKNYPTKIGKIGSRYLALRLRELLLNHIQLSLPNLIKSLAELTEANETRLRILGPAIAEGFSNKMLLILRIITDFVHKFKTAIKIRPPVKAAANELFPVEITDIFDDFSKNLYTIDNPENDSEELDQKIKSGIRNSVDIEGFTSIEDVFKELVKEEILQMEKTCIKCADEIHVVLSKAVGHCLKNTSLAILNSEICKETKKVLKEQLRATKESIKQHFQIETGMICSFEETFRRLLKVSDPVENDEAQDALLTLIKQHPSIRASIPLASKISGSETNHAFVKLLITEYYNVVRRQIADHIPKLIIFHLVDRTLQKKTGEDLVSVISNCKSISGSVEALASEPDHIIQQRNETQEMLEKLAQATEIIEGLQTAT